MKRNGRINPVSARRRAQVELRRQVCEIVRQRARGRCWYGPVVPEIKCRSYDSRRPALEVDELRGGAYRCTEMYDPDQCRLTCQAHHDHKTDHKPEVLERLAEYEQEHPWPTSPALPPAA